MRFDGILDAIGHTPLIRLRIGTAPEVEVYAKLELSNLYGMKDRVARHAVLEARRTGVLAEGAPIIESSSGTMALGVAMVGAALGHPVHVVTDPRIDPISLAKLRALGAVVHTVDTMSGQGWQGARLARLAELRETLPGAFWPEQYANPDNPAAYRALAAELVADLGALDVLVGSVGTGGSLCGSARALRERLPSLRVVGVDSVGSVLFGQPDRPGRLQGGLGNSLLPKNLDRRQVDEVHWLNDREAFTATVDLAREQQIFGGNTSGSVYRVLRHVAETSAPGTRIVGIFPDRGDRYVDTVYSESFWAERGVLEQSIAATPAVVAPGTVVDGWSSLQWPAVSRPLHLLFVEANTSGTGVLALDVARRLGLTPVLLTNNPSRYAGLGESDVLACDTSSTAALRAAIKDRFRREELVGLTSTSDFYVATAAELADWLGMPRNPVDAMRVCRDKSLLRERLAAEDVTQPRFAVARQVGEVRTAVAAVGLPCVVKPVDDSASNAVLLCHTEDQALRHAAGILSTTVNVRGLPTAGAVLVEEYLSGPELSVELFSVDGVTEVVGITDKSVTSPPYFVEYRHVFPARLQEATAAAVIRTALAAVEAAGVTLGATHTEVKLTPRGVAVIEINPRLAGGMIPALVEHATGVDLLEQQLRATAGLPVSLTPTRRRHAGVQFRLAERPRSGYDRLGHVIAHADTQDDVVAALAAQTALDGEEYTEARAA